MPRLRDEFPQQVRRLQAHVAGGRAVGTADGFRRDGRPVDDEPDPDLRVGDEAQGRGGAHFRAQEFLQHRGGSEGHAGNLKRGTEVLGAERFVTRHHIQVEHRLLPVAEKEGLHRGNAQRLVDGDTVFHRHGRVVVDASEGDFQPLQGGIDLPLGLVGERLGSGRADVAGMDHIFSAQLMPSRAEETMPPA